MKIIHTSDWHIGKIVNEMSMIEDQKIILNKLLELTKKEKPDVLIIAGDLYDRSVPPVEAVSLLDEVLSKLTVDLGIKVIAISGNHDSGERISFSNKLLEKQGLYIAGEYESLYKKVTLNDEFGEVIFYLVPYKDPAIVRKLLEDKEIRNHNDSMKATLDIINKDLDKTKRNILVGHGYVTMSNKEEDITSYEEANIEVSDSERPLAIGGTDIIDGRIFDDFDYVALGHLHGRQKIGRETMRYSGSLLKYSFSEVNQKKGVVVLSIDKDKKIEIDFKELIPIRDLRNIKGELDSLIEEGRELKDGRDDYIQAILTDEGELIDPMNKIRAVYKNTMIITRENKRDNSNLDSAKEGFKVKSEAELFKAFYENFGNSEYDDIKEDIIKEVINEVLKEEV